MTATNPPENDLINRNCGYCGKTFNITQIELLIHLHKCEKEKAEEYQAKKNK